jgi:hypothetical protein
MRKQLDSIAALWSLGMVIWSLLAGGKFALLVAKVPGGQARALQPVADPA